MLLNPLLFNEKIVTLDESLAQRLLAFWISIMMKKINKV